MVTSPGFQGQVNAKSAPAVEGDFASKNPFATYDAGPGGLVAGASGCIVGRGAWVTNPSDADGTPSWADNFGTGDISGILHREQQALLTTYLQEYGMTVPAGFPITLMVAGDLWVKNVGSAQALPGMKAFCRYADGTFEFAAAAATPNTASFTGSIAARTGSFTGTITDSVLNITAVGSGTLVAGMTLAGTGGSNAVAVATNTKIVRQLSGTTGGVGVYAVSIPEQQVTLGTITGTVGLLTVSAVASGALEVGDVLSGGSVTAGTVITQALQQAGGTGTWWVDPTQTTTSSPSLSALRAKETKWFARSAALQNELVKISSYALG